MRLPDFPYLIIASARDVEHHRNMGYRGWRQPGQARRLKAGLPPPPTIPRADWARQIALLGDANLAKKFPLPAKDQNGLGYCWVYGTTRAVEVDRLRLGLAALDLCPESLGGPLTDWKNEGGYAAEAFQGLETAGIAESYLCPTPHSLNPRLWDSAWQTNAKSHECMSWYDLESDDRQPTFDEVITALLTPLPVAAGLDWWGHLVAFLAAVVIPRESGLPPNTPTDDTIGVLFQNSWGPDWPSKGENGYAVLTEAFATPDGAGVPIIVQ